MKGHCGHLQPAAKKLCAAEKRNKKRSTVEEQQCVSGNPFPLRSRNTECSFNQPLSALCGCREPTWPNSKLIHFSIDLFDNNRGKSFPFWPYSRSRAAPGEGRSLSPLPQVMAATSCCNTLRWLSVELALRLLSTAKPPPAPLIEALDTAPHHPSTGWECRWGGERRRRRRRRRGSREWKMKERRAGRGYW